MFGILIATIMIAACFLGYSTTYGAMAHWALRVVMGLVRCVPYLDTWFYGNYAVSYAMLSKCMVFHFLIVMVALVLMILHLIMLHSTGSSAGTALTTVPGYHRTYTTMSMLMCALFLIAHSLDHASMDSYVNSHSSVSFRLMITTVHASHVLMCAMFIVLLNVNVLMTLGIIMLAYCHLVEVLWIAIMSITMLCELTTSTIPMTDTCNTVTVRTVRTNNHLITMLFNFLLGLTFVLVCMFSSLCFLGYSFATGAITITAGAISPLTMTLTSNNAGSILISTFLHKLIGIFYSMLGVAGVVTRPRLAAILTYISVARCICAFLIGFCLIIMYKLATYPVTTHTTTIVNAAASATPMKH